MRLFQGPRRIPCRMSATAAILTNIGTRFSLPAQAGASPAGKLYSMLASMLVEDDAQQLALALKRRDPDVLDRLIEQYQFRLFRYLVYLTGNRERAEDFFQETWIRVLERGHQYEGKWKFETWLFAIARNLVIDWQRRIKPQSLDELMQPREDGAAFDPPADTEHSPLQQAMRSQEDAHVQDSLTRLPAIYREVLLLRFQEEMALEEISRLTSTPLSTVKSRLYRGVEALRVALQGGAA